MALPTSIDPQSRPKLPQFTLRSMFLATGCLAMVFAVCQAIGPLASCGLMVGLALVGLHVIGNVLGTRLRNEAYRTPANGRNGEASPGPGQYPAIVPARFDQPHSVSRLSQRTPLGWMILATTVIGGVMGSVAGQWVLVNSAEVSLRGLLLGSASSGVLGAFVGFLFGCLAKTWLSAWWQASSESDRFDKRLSVPRFSSTSPPCNVPSALITDIDAG